MNNEKAIKGTLNNGFEVSDESLERLEAVLNKYLCNVDLEQVTLSLISEMERTVGVEAYLDYADAMEFIGNNHITDFIDEIDGKTGLLICTEEVIKSQRDTLTIQKAAE